MSQTEVKRLFDRMSTSQIRKVASLSAQALSQKVGMSHFLLNDTDGFEDVELTKYGLQSLQVLVLDDEGFERLPVQFGLSGLDLFTHLLTICCKSRVLTL